MLRLIEGFLIRTLRFREQVSSGFIGLGVLERVVMEASEVLSVMVECKVGSTLFERRRCRFSVLLYGPEPASNTPLKAHWLYPNRSGLAVLPFKLECELTRLTKI